MPSVERIRVIPSLLLSGDGLVKTVRFQKPVYVGDPINTVKIFNEKEVDEIAVLDIGATRNGREPNFEKIAEIAGECFMPMAYGGGITSVAQMRRILLSGVEKVILNSIVFRQPQLIRAAADQFGSQSVVVSIDAKPGWFGRYQTRSHGGTVRHSVDPVTAAVEAVRQGAGEILLNSVDRDGTYLGYDTDLLRKVTSAVCVPVIACGGARNVQDFVAAVRDGGAAAVAAGSMFVFHGVHKAVLVNFPSETILREQFFQVCRQRS